MAQKQIPQNTRGQDTEGATNLSVHDIEELFVRRFGPMMDLQQVADALNRSRDAVRYALSQPKRIPLGRALNTARKGSGSRVYFKSRLIARLSLTHALPRPLAEAS